MSSQSSASTHPVRRVPRALLAAVAASTMLALAACSSPAPEAAPSSSPSANTATPRPTPTPTAPPELVPGGTAAENLPYFDHIAATVLAAEPAAGGASFVNALVAAGFAQADMEVGFDRTSIDLAADSVQWSVRLGEHCLIGQFGPATGGYHSGTAAILSTGTCLIGQTRPIDW